MLPLEVAVDSVEKTGADTKFVSCFGLDAPVAGGGRGDQNIVFAGWIVAASGFSTSGVRVVCGRMALKEAMVNVPRPDVLQSGLAPESSSDRIGFHFEIGTMGLPVRAELVLMVDMEAQIGEGKQSVELCRVSLSQVGNLRLEARYSPILVTALGRSGTTLLMQCLDQHPEVLVTSFYPYEVRQAAYWWHLMMISSAPADYAASAHPDSFGSARFKAGHHPYSHPEFVNQYRDPSAVRRYYTASNVEAWARFCIDRVDDYYQLVADESDKPDARLYAEKLPPGPLQNVARLLYCSRKEVILTRDFRDVVCSAQSFNTKRSGQAFGRDKVNDDFAWVDRLAVHGALRLLDAWNARGDGALLLRYEDLVLHPAVQLQRLFEYLDVDASPAIVDRIVRTIEERRAKDSSHGTTRSPKASIGRWRVDLSADMQEYCLDRFGPALKSFGYE